jgi:hypothetical protein
VMHTGHGIPARPNPPTVFRVQNSDGSVQEVVKEELPLAPISKFAWVEKLGYKKNPIIGSDSWTRRHIRLESTSIGYYENDITGVPKGSISLNPGVTLRVIQSNEPARKDRYEDGHNPGVGALMTMQIGQIMNHYSTPIGKPNCVEVYIPVQGVGSMINNLMGQSAASLAGGGIKAVKNTKARSYYFSFSNLADAQDFASAVENNVKVLAKQNAIGNDSAAGAGDAIRGGDYSKIDNVMNMAYATQNNQKLMTSPDTSLEWYKTTLNSSLPADVMYEKLMTFYDQLAQFNIYSPYK